MVGRAMGKQIAASPAAVTIVVPSYNHKDYLEQALNSVAAQHSAVELIVVDGGSTDGTRAILERWADRLAWWRSASDKGQSAAINEGMAKGTAPLVGWLNSDDWYLDGGLDALVNYLERHPDCPGVYADALNADSAGNVTSRYFTQSFSRRNLAWRCFIAQPATLLRRSVWETVGGLDETLHYAMDYDLWWKIFLSFGPLDRLRQDVSVNRAHSGTKTRSARREQCLEAMRVVKRHNGRIPMKWYLAWPYSVWYKTLRNRLAKSFEARAAT
jgi:glycosyltransferase involved in cell wall biosynthesis